MSIGLTDWTKKQIQQEFECFNAPAGFKGGCKKTHCHGLCVQLRPDGTIGGVDENCEHYDVCNGHKFRYNL